MGYLKQTDIFEFVDDLCNNKNGHNIFVSEETNEIIFLCEWNQKYFKFSFNEVVLINESINESQSKEYGLVVYDYYIELKNGKSEIFSMYLKDILS